MTHPEKKTISCWVAVGVFNLSGCELFLRPENTPPHPLFSARGANIYCIYMYPLLCYGWRLMEKGGTERSCWKSRKLTWTGGFWNRANVVVGGVPYVDNDNSCTGTGTTADGWTAPTGTGGRSAIKFHKSQILKFADLNILLDWRTIRKCGTLRICDLRTPSFCDLRALNFRK